MFDHLSRRQFVKLTGGFVAGTAAAGSLPLIDLLPVNAQNTGYKFVGYFNLAKSLKYIGIALFW